MHSRRLVPLVLCLGLSSPAGATLDLETEAQKTVYALGLVMARQLADFDLSADEMEIVAAALADVAANRSPRVDVEIYSPKIKELAADRRERLASAERDASRAFLEQAAAEEGARTTESGLVFRETLPGSGESPKATDTVEVHYHGTLRDGAVFDSSVERGQPAKFPLNRVIPCWTEALQLMRVGGKATITCPAEIAYGDRGAASGRIKPGSALRFEVQLLAIEP